MTAELNNKKREFALIKRQYLNDFKTKTKSATEQLSFYELQKEVALEELDMTAVYQNNQYFEPEVEEITELEKQSVVEKDYGVVISSKKRTKRKSNLKKSAKLEDDFLLKEIHQFVYRRVIEEEKGDKTHILEMAIRTNIEQPTLEPDPALKAIRNHFLLPELKETTTVKDSPKK